MWKYLAKKLTQMLLMLLAISFLIFVGLNATGIDPVYYTIGMDNMDNTEALDAVRERYGLDQPLVVRYFNWIGGILRGDFGYSLITGVPISKTLQSRLYATMELAMLAMLLSTIIGVTIGIISAVWKNSLIDYLGRIFAVLGQSLPAYFVGICLIEVFAIKLGWLPTSGRLSIGDTTFLDRLDHIILPLAAMTMGMCAALVRFTRNNMLDVATRDYVKTARSKGIPEWKVYIKHVFRNGMRPVMVVVVMRLGMLIGGSVAIESVFAWPGLGSELTSAITSGDYPVVMIITLLMATVILIASFVVDIITAMLDPRVRFEAK